MKIYGIGLLLFVLFSCNDTRSRKPAVQDQLPVLKKDSPAPQSVMDEKKVMHRQKDTVLKIIIEDISEEGSDVTASYIQDTLRNATWEIYGESGKAVIVYTFSRDGKVHVLDKQATYKVRLENVKSGRDMKWDSVTYLLDTNGVLLSKMADTDRANGFSYFKKNVPLILDR